MSHVTSPAIQLESCWADFNNRRTRPPLNASTSADVCIVGAGMAGISTAHALAERGLSVVVLDDGQIGGGQTEVTTAHLTYVLDRRFYEIEKTRGLENARLAAESHRTAIDRIESVAQQEQIACDFMRVDGFLFPHESSAVELLDREMKTLERMGLTGVSRLLQGPSGCHMAGPCAVFSHQAQFHPLKYLMGLAAATERLGGRIHGGSHVKKIESTKDAEEVRVMIEGGQSVTAHQVVIATNTPINTLLAIHTKQAPYISYVVAFAIPKGALPRALFWDTADPFHYVRLQPVADDDQTDLLIVGGEDHKTGQANDGEERWHKLETWGREHFPAVQEVRYTWSGQVMESTDGLAYLGRSPGGPQNQFLATGDSGLGMTHGTIAGQLIADLITHQANPWEQLYNPARIPTGAPLEYAQENLNVAMQYTDWLTPGEVSDANEVQPGCGAIMRQGLSKVALYRNKQGELTRLSAVCPHLKGLVRWNSAESTWDCPCHGSRFTPEGKVLNGPANTSLSPIKE